MNNESTRNSITTQKLGTQNNEIQEMHPRRFKLCILWGELPNFNLLTASTNINADTSDAFL